MDLNTLQELHEDLKELIIEKYVKEKKVSIGEIKITADKTFIQYFLKDKKGQWTDTNYIEFDNNSWNIKE